MAGKADAVFLDVPGPWDVIHSAARSLKPAGALCSFSPCIEQVKKACDMMRQCGFDELYTTGVPPIYPCRWFACPLLLLPLPAPRPRPHPRPPLPPPPTIPSLAPPSPTTFGTFG